MISLWHRYGVEYDIIGTAENPAEMPLLGYPVVDHYWILHTPHSLNSGAGTETARGASDDLTTGCSVTATNDDSVNVAPASFSWNHPLDFSSILSTNTPDKVTSRLLIFIRWVRHLLLLTRPLHSVTARKILLDNLWSLSVLQAPLVVFLVASMA